VGGGDGQGATVFGAVLLAYAFEVADFAQDQVNALEHVLAGLGHTFEAFAVAGEDFYAQFFFQLDDGFGNTGLRSVQGFGGFRQVEVAAYSFLDKAKLVQVHIESLLKKRFIMPDQMPG
jgi:hypothetical protein